MMEDQIIRISQDLSRVQPRLDRMSQRGQVILASQVHADSNIYAPRLSGDLRSQSMRVNNDTALKWGVPYARKQWFGKTWWDYTTPGTGPEWVEKAREVHLASWVRITEDTMRRTR